jgi:hypothetical protein
VFTCGVQDAVRSVVFSHCCVHYALWDLWYSSDVLLFWAGVVCENNCNHKQDMVDI